MRRITVWKITAADVGSDFTMSCFFSRCCIHECNIIVLNRNRFDRNKKPIRKNLYIRFPELFLLCNHSETTQLPTGHLHHFASHPLPVTKCVMRSHDPNETAASFFVYRMRGPTSKMSKPQRAHLLKPTIGYNYIFGGNAFVGLDDFSCVQPQPSDSVKTVSSNNRIIDVSTKITAHRRRITNDRMSTYENIHQVNMICTPHI